MWLVAVEPTLGRTAANCCTNQRKRNTLKCFNQVSAGTPTSSVKTRLLRSTLQDGSATGRHIEVFPRVLQLTGNCLQKKFEIMDESQTKMLACQSHLNYVKHSNKG